MKNKIVKWIGGFLYVIAFVLLLEVLKKIVTRQPANSSFFFATIIICIQFFFVAGYIILFCFYQLFSRIRLRRKWLLSFACIFTIFTLTEWLYNSLLNDPKYIPAWLLPAFQFYYDQYDCRMTQMQRNAAVYDPGLFYTLKPQSSFYYNNREFTTMYHTNSQGLRDDEQSLQSPEIICLGDSYAMGWGVQQQETYAQRLEQLTGMKVLNAAISSYGTAREMKLLTRLDTSKLKYVIIQYCGNDIDENVSFISNHGSLSISSREAYDSAVVSHEQNCRYYPGKYCSLITQLIVKQQVNKLFQVFYLPFGRVESMGDMHEHAASFVNVLNAGPVDFKKVKVIVTIVESKFHKNNSFLAEVQKLIQQEPYKTRFAGNVSVLDVATILDESDYLQLDLHITSKAHQKIAQKLKQAIEVVAN